MWRDISTAGDRDSSSRGGGIFIREIETMINQSPTLIKYLAEELEKRGIPMITPPGVCNEEGKDFGDSL